MPIIRFNQIDLHYETRGQGDPLLLIHGLGSSVRDWENQLPFFAGSYQVIALDLRGHGNSDKPPGPYSSRLFANDVAGLIRSLGTFPVHVVGLSLGGFIACQLACDHAELVRTLTVVNSLPALPRETIGDRLKVGSALGFRRLVVRLFGMRVLGLLLSKKLFPRADQQALRQVFIERWSENDRSAYLSSLATVSDWDLEDRLDSISCPVCLLSGEYDFFPLALKKYYAARLPNARLAVIRGSGHFSPMDEPARFNQAVVDFLAETV